MKISEVDSIVDERTEDQVISLATINVTATMTFIENWQGPGGREMGFGHRSIRIKEQER